MQLETFVVLDEVSLHCVDVIKAKLVDYVAKLIGQVVEAEFAALKSDLIPRHARCAGAGLQCRHLLDCQRLDPLWVQYIAT